MPETIENGPKQQQKDQKNFVYFRWPRIFLECERARVKEKPDE